MYLSHSPEHFSSSTHTSHTSPPSLGDTLILHTNEMMHSHSLDYRSITSHTHDFCQFHHSGCQSDPLIGPEALSCVFMCHCRVCLHGCDFFPSAAASAQNMETSHSKTIDRLRVYSGSLTAGLTLSVDVSCKEVCRFAVSRRGDPLFLDFCSGTTVAALHPLM